ncbi:MAG: MarR family transcriptional regulator [Opitutaceae bacterium]|nr:MarR family transcriptional regulator [Opitutaceae bacterium]
MKPALAEDLVLQTLRTASTLVRASRRVFRPHGLSEAQFNVLNILAAPARAAGVTQREISDILVVDRSNVTGLLDRMEAAGWVRREAVPEDRRAWRVRLTAPGRRLWEKCVPDYARAVQAVVAPLGAEKARAVRDLLAALECQAAAMAGGGDES